MSKDVKKQKTFWPYGILLSIFAIIIACIATIIFSLDYPVYSDNFYFEKYRKVDENFDKIEKSQKNFDAKFSVAILNQKAQMNANSVEISIKPKIDFDIKKLKAEILLTRPETSEFDKNLKSTLNDEILKTEIFDLPKPGRWQILLKISDEIDIGFYKFEISTNAK